MTSFTNANATSEIVCRDISTNARRISFTGRSPEDASARRVCRCARVRRTEIKRTVTIGGEYRRNALIFPPECCAYLESFKIRYHRLLDSYRTRLVSLPYTFEDYIVAPVAIIRSESALFARDIRSRLRE